jgi:hypothetical protein
MRTVFVVIAFNLNEKRQTNEELNICFTLQAHTMTQLFSCYNKSPHQPTSKQLNSFGMEKRNEMFFRERGKYFVVKWEEIFYFNFVNIC